MLLDLTGRDPRRHSLPGGEAEVLCDRIGIMSDGVMKCLDIPAKLKQRYGEGYKLSIHTSDRSQVRIQLIPILLNFEYHY